MNNIIPNDNDVIWDGTLNQYVQHPGNKKYRLQVSSILFQYKNADRALKQELRLKIRDHIRNHEGRFLQFDPSTSQFLELHDKAVDTKISQLLRNQLKDHRRETIPTNELPKDLENVLSSFCDVPQSKVTSLLSDPTIRNQVHKHLQDISKLMKEAMSESTQSETPKHLQQMKSSTSLLTPRTKTTNDAAIDQSISKIFQIYSQMPTNVPSAKSLSQFIPPIVGKSPPRNFFYDHDVCDPYAWNELENRLLPKKHVYKIVSIYAFHVHRIHKLTIVSTSTNRNIRKYKCSTCPDTTDKFWSVTICRSRDSPDLWQVRPESCTCICQCHARKKEKLSDQLFLNVTYVRRIVSRNYWKAPAFLDDKIVSEFRFYDIQKNQLPGIAHRKQALMKLLDLEIMGMRKRHHKLPRLLHQLLQRNPQMSIALQSDHNNCFHCAFIGLPWENHLSLFKN